MKITLIKVNYWLKWVILVGFVLLAVLSVIYKYNDCAKCEFEINETEVGAQEFMNYYHTKCLEIEGEERLIKGQNFSLNISS